LSRRRDRKPILLSFLTPLFSNIDKNSLWGELFITKKGACAPIKKTIKYGELHGRRVIRRTGMKGEMARDYKR